MTEEQANNRRWELMNQISKMLRDFEEEYQVDVTKATFSPTTCPVIEISIKPIYSSECKSEA